MTTPQAILTGFTLLALAIASLPYSNGLISPAFAYGEQEVRVVGYETDMSMGETLYVHCTNC